MIVLVVAAGQEWQEYQKSRGGAKGSIGGGSGSGSGNGSVGNNGSCCCGNNRISVRTSGSKSGSHRRSQQQLW